MITDPELLAAERAINEVRCGRAILLRGDAGTSLYAAIETAEAVEWQCMSTRVVEGVIGVSLVRFPVFSR